MLRSTSGGGLGKTVVVQELYRQEFRVFAIIKSGKQHNNV